MTRALRLFLATLFFAAGLASPAWAGEAGDRVTVQVSAAKALFSGDSDVTIQVTVTNNNLHAVKVAKYHLPLDGFSAPWFTITAADGSRVAYTGPVVKRARPSEADVLNLGPGASLSFPVELSAFYDFGNGLYTIQYADIAATSGLAGLRPIAAISLKTEGRTLVARKSPAAPAITPQGVSYSGNCSATRKTAISSAIAGAKAYALAGKNYFTGKTNTATTRYTKWFGAATTSRISTGRTHFTNIYNTLLTQALVMDCSCKEKNTYAYVYPDSPYKVYLCGAFWSAPTTGTDSKAGTLIHEFSHFTVIAGTDDYVYGQTDALSLALSNPTQALDNADNHEYFAENNPAVN
jgi:peptidyl-Lys metalloendopeptidase